MNSTAPTAAKLRIAPINTAEPTTLSANRMIALTLRAGEGLTSAVRRWTSGADEADVSPAAGDGGGLTLRPLSEPGSGSR